MQASFGAFVLFPLIAAIKLVIKQSATLSFLYTAITPRIFSDTQKFSTAANGGKNV